MVPLQDVWFPFTVGITSKSFPWAVRCTPERNSPKFLAMSVVRFYPIPALQYTAVLVWPRSIDMSLMQPVVRHIEEKQTELETDSK